MAQTLETIRLLRIRAVAEGLDRAAQQNVDLAEAMQKVASAAELQAEKTEKSANRNLNALKAWESYQRQTDSTFNAIDRFDKRFMMLSKNFAQNAMSPARFREELEKLNQSLDAAGVPRNFAGLGFEEVRRQAQETLRLREQERQKAEQILEIERKRRELDAQWLGERTRSATGLDRVPATQAGASFSALEERERMREQVEAQRRQNDALWLRQRLEETTGVGRGSAMAGGASYSALAEREKALEDQRLAQEKRRAELQGRANEYLERSQPLLQAQARYAKELAEIEEMRSLRLLSQEQAIEAQADALHRLNVIQSAQSIGGNRLNRAEMTNIGYQVNDIVTMMASGSNPFQILATQGPQIYQILAGSRGGVAAGIKEIGRAFVEMMTPVRVASGLLVTTAIAAALAWNRYHASIQAVERSLMGLGRGTEATSRQLIEGAEAAASGAGLSNRESRQVTSTLAATGRISTQIYGDMIKSAKDYAAITGQDIPDAMGELASRLADPARGAAELDKQFNLFNATQLKAIEQMARSGDKMGAQRAIMQALGPAISGAAEKTSVWARAWNEVANFASNAADAVGKAVDRMVSGPSPEERMRQLAEARRNRERTPDRAIPNAGASPLLSGPLQNQARRADQAMDPARRDMEYAAQTEAREMQRMRYLEMQAARVRDLSRDMREIYQGLDPFNDGIEQLRKNIEALGNAVEDSRFRLLPEGEQERIREALGYQERALTAMERYKGAGGQSYYEGRRASRFEVDTSAMTELERQIAAINQSYKDQVEAARATIENSGRLAQAERTLLDIRNDQLEALRRSTAMGVARSTMPWMFEQSQIQEQLDAFRSVDPSKLGLSGEQAAAVIERLESRLRNLKTPMEQLVQDYELEQRAISAVTFEQRAAVDSQKAYTDAIRSGKTEMEAAVIAVMAFNRAVAQSQRAAFEAVREAKEAAGMVGLNPYEREQAGIRNRYGRMRQEHGNQPGFDAAEQLEGWTARQEAMRGPLEDANRSLNEQIGLARAQASTFGRSTAEIEAAAEAQRLYNEYARAGVPITADIAAGIHAYAQRAGEARQAIEIITEQQRNLEAYKDMGKDALKGFLSDLRQGKDAGEALLNVLNRIVDRLLDMMMESLFNPNSQGGFNFLQMLFGGGPNRGTSLPSMVQNPFPGGFGGAMPQVGNYNPTGVPLSSGINAAIAGSAVPAFSTQSQQILSNVTSSVTQSIGRTFTSVSDGLRHTVEQYVRSGAMARGFDPDVIARGVRQESGFNPYAVGDGGKSFGVMQLYTGGGLGNLARQRGISLSPENWREQVDFSLDQMRPGHGRGLAPWYGFRDSGIRDPWAHIRGSSGTDQLRGGAGFDQLGTSVERASTGFDNLNPSLNQFGTQFQSVTQTLQNTSPQLAQGFRSIDQVIGQGGRGVGDALQDTSGVVNQSGQGLGSAISNLARSLQSGGGGGGLGGLGSLFGGMFNSGAGDWSNTASWTIPSGFSLGFHRGGNVGSGGTLRSINLMDQIAFMSAPRLHRGTISPDERYAILQTGETVLSRQDTQNARRNGQQMAQATVVQPVVNIIGAPSQPEVKQNPDGSVDVVFEQFESWQAERAKRGKGPLVKAIGARRDTTALIG